MKAYASVTDRGWWNFLGRQAGITEVNFWQPGGGRQFRTLLPEQPFLFELHDL